MTDRFSPGGVFKAHWASLFMRSYEKEGVTNRGRDWVAIFFLYFIPLIVAVISFFRGFIIGGTGALIGAASLIAAGLLSVFVQLSTSRARFSGNKASNLPERDLLDESVSHVLVGVYCALCLVIALAVHEIMGKEAACWALHLSSSVVIFFSLVLIGLFLLIIPAIWAAYDRENNVPRRMGGSNN